jgi:hypothetical protein
VLALTFRGAKQVYAVVNTCCQATDIMLMFWKRRYGSSQLDAVCAEESSIRHLKAVTQPQYTTDAAGPPGLVAKQLL